MKTIVLTQADYDSINYMLGIAWGHLIKEGNHNEAGKHAVDMFIMQGGPNNYTYHFPKNQILAEIEELKKAG